MLVLNLVLGQEAFAMACSPSLYGILPACHTGSQDVSCFDVAFCFELLTLTPCDGEQYPNFYVQNLSILDVEMMD